MSLIKPRPLVRWHGGKWAIAPWIVEHIPRHRVYVEPFGGGGSVLLRKPRSYGEVYNDLDGEIVNLFRVTRDRGPALQRAVRLTPYARAEFQASDDRPAAGPVERARRTLVRAFMGFGSLSPARRASGFRTNLTRTGSAPVHDWANFPDALDMTIRRLRGVVIEQRPAVTILREHDGPGTVHYCDPPYLPETRDHGQDYRHEMTPADHAELAAVLHELKGAVLVSGYPSQLYDGLYKGWQRLERRAFANGARQRTEVLWIRPAR